MTEPVILREDTAKRGTFEKHFERSDGSYIATTYPEQVHYQDSDGEWNEIDNSLVPALENHAEILQNKDGLIDVSFYKNPDGEMGSMQYGGYSLRWNVTAAVYEQEKYHRLTRYNTVLRG